MSQHLVLESLQNLHHRHHCPPLWTQVVLFPILFSLSYIFLYLDGHHVDIHHCVIVPIFNKQMPSQKTTSLWHSTRPLAPRFSSSPIMMRINRLSWSMRMVDSKIHMHIFITIQWKRDPTTKATQLSWMQGYVSDAHFGDGSTIIWHHCDIQHDHLHQWVLILRFPSTYMVLWCTRVVSFRS